MSRRRQPSIVEEFEGASLGDERRSRRLVAIAQAVDRAPDESFPKATGGDAALEGTYRLLENPAIEAEAILQPHIKMTCARAAELDEVLAIHDTTEFDYGKNTARRGMGILSSAKKKGFLAHISLLVAPGEDRLPLGVAALHHWVRPRKKPRLRPELRARDPNRESKRWFEQAELVDARIAGSSRTVHVMDRDSDAYPLLAKFVGEGRRFVLRSCHERLLGEEADMKLSEVIAAQAVRCERAVRISARAAQGAPKAKARFPERTARIARLGFAAASVEIHRPRGAPATSLGDTVRVNVVRVIEQEPPAGERPVEWRLLTTEPIDTERDLLRIVDIYRARWTIEDFFKAVKTGCAFGQRQLESYAALSKALALLLPIAWRMLLLRALSRSTPEVRAEKALTQIQLRVLRAVSKKPLPAAASAAEALAAIAALGGHIKNNGPPGWQVLGRGYHDLLLLEVGWAAREREM